jgi:hypothetical protein
MLFIYNLIGCAYPARYGKMVPEAYLFKPTPDKFFLKNKIVLEEVTGGKETNPLWVSEVGNQEFKRALRESLRVQQLLASNSADGKYGLTVSLEEISHPIFGFDTTAVSSVHYFLRKNKTNRIIFDKRITVSHTATSEDAYEATIRGRVANEGAVRKNINNFLNLLLLLKNRFKDSVNPSDNNENYFNRDENLIKPVTELPEPPDYKN